jgi:hypothetical protein
MYFIFITQRDGYYQNNHIKVNETERTRSVNTRSVSEDG